MKGIRIVTQGYVEDIVLIDLITCHVSANIIASGVCHPSEIGALRIVFYGYSREVNQVRKT